VPQPVVIEIHVGSETVAVHEHDVPAETVKLPVPPVEDRLFAAG
jgi:hypothetical protein